MLINEVEVEKYSLNLNQVEKVKLSALVPNIAHFIY